MAQVETLQTQKNVFNSSEGNWSLNYLMVTPLPVYLDLKPNFEKSSVETGECSKESAFDYSKTINSGSDEAVFFQKQPDFNYLGRRERERNVVTEKRRKSIGFYFTQKKKEKSISF